MATPEGLAATTYCCDINFDDERMPAKSTGRVSGWGYVRPTHRMSGHKCRCVLGSTCAEGDLHEGLVP